MTCGIWHRGPNALAIQSTCFCVTMMPAMAAFMLVFMRLPTLKCGLLLPVDRKSYLRQLGAAAALGHFKLWAGASVAIIAWWLLVAREPRQLSLLSEIVIVAGVYQVWVFGTLVWLTKYPSRITVMLVGMLIMMSQSVVDWATRAPTATYAGLNELPIPFDYEMVLWALLAAVPALLMVYLGYRRWLVADFDS